MKYKEIQRIIRNMVNIVKLNRFYGCKSDVSISEK